MSHEHAQDNPSRSLPMNQPMGRVARERVVLEYGRADAGQKRAARVWHRTRGMGSTPSYVLSGDSSSGGYVTA